MQISYKQELLDIFLLPPYLKRMYIFKFHDATKNSKGVNQVETIGKAAIDIGTDIQIILWNTWPFWPMNLVVCLFFWGLA